MPHTPAALTLSALALAAIGVLAAGAYAETIRVPDQP